MDQNMQHFAEEKFLITVTNYSWNFTIKCLL